MKKCYRLGRLLLHAVFSIHDPCIIKKGAWPAACLLICCTAVQAQQTVISGVVTDDKNDPLPGVSIQVKDTKTGVTTGTDGSFSLTVPDIQRSVLIATFIGYERTEMPLAGRKQVQITLQTGNRKLDEVVVVGYGNQQKVKLTGAVATLKGEEIVTTRNENVQNMLTGKVAGVRVVQNSAEPGSFSNTFDIRGLGAPLVVIDGVPRDNFTRLDANDIESISVLKDASAAVYGVRAANGVVLITTKKGKTGAPRLSYSVTGGLQYAAGLPKTLGAIDWMTLANEKAMHNPDGGVRPYTPDIFEQYRNGTLASTDWYPAVVRRSAPQTQHSLTASGGTEKMNYYISLGYLSQEGFWKSGDLNYKKFNVRSNLSARISDRLTADLQLSGITDTKQQPSADAWTVFQSLWRHPPYLPVYANNDPGYLNSLGDNGPNAAAISNADVSGYKKNNNKWFQGAFSLNYDVPFLPGLKAKAMYSYDYYVADNKTFAKTYNLYLYEQVPNTGNYFYNPKPFQTPSNVNRYYGANQNTLMQFSLNYEHGFGDHNVSSLLLYEETTRKGDNFYANRNLILGNLDQLISGSSLNQVAYQNKDGLFTLANKGLVGKVHYDFKAKYLLDFSFRYDGSSKFPPGKQWGFFPGVAAGWRISEENFKRNTPSLSFIDNLKLRGSYGVMGDDGSSQFQFIQGYDFPATGNAAGLAGGYVLNGAFSPALGFRNLPNPNITWFTAKTLDIGIDADLWNGLFGFQFDWFRRNRSGLLANRVLTLPGSLGAALPQENLNSDRSSGVELVLTHNNRIGGVNYRVSGNISYTRTKWAYNERAAAGNSYLNWRNNVNNRYNDIWWGLGDAGRFESFADIYGYKINTGGGNRGTLPGDYKYEDWNNDGYIDDLDRHPIASTFNGATNSGTATPNPPLVNFGLSFGANYRGFDLDLLFQGVAMKWIAYPESLASPLNFNGNALEQFMDRWHPADPAADPYDPNTEYVPGDYPYTGTTADINSLFSVKNASYVRLKSVELGYTIPRHLTRIVGMQSIRVYLNGYNLLTVTGIRNVDPEHPSDFYGYVYPLNKTFNIGANVTF